MGKIAIAYYSKTNQTENFVKKIKEILPEQEFIKIGRENKCERKKFILLTPTYRFGEVPSEVTDFLNYNHEYLVAVMASGNKNWGSNFAKSGDIISEAFNVPLISKYELSGTKRDIEILISYLKSLED